MEWNLANGGKIEYYESRQLKGYKTPLDDRPEGTIDTQSYLDAFYTVSHFRVSGMGVNPLNLENIISYHTHINPYGELAEFIRILIACDRVFIKFHNDKQG